MPNPQWLHKFELKPGCWVFVPTADTVARGTEIKSAIAAKWRVPHYYAHLRPGGHVFALKKHLRSNLFIRADIKQFFNQVNRTRVTRALKLLFKDYSLARGFACESTIAQPNHEPLSYILPFGFVQSAIIASLCLHKSGLGQYLNKLESSGRAKVSVYMDDIIISTSLPLDAAEEIAIELKTRAEKSKFCLNPEKTIGPVKNISVFNIDLSKNKIVINQERLAAFRKSLLESDNDNVREGILGYITTVCPEQASLLARQSEAQITQ